MNYTILYPQSSNKSSQQKPQLLVQPTIVVLPRDLRMLVSNSVVISSCSSLNTLEYFTVSWIGSNLTMLSKTCCSIGGTGALSMQRFKCR